MEASRQQEAGAEPFASHVVIRLGIVSCSDSPSGISLSGCAGFARPAHWRGTRGPTRSTSLSCSSWTCDYALCWSTRWFRLDCVLIDIPYAVDHVAASHVIDIVLSLLVLWRKVFGGGNQEEALKNLSTLLKDWSRSRRNSRWIESWAILKAKAAATRHFAAYAFLSNGSVEDRQAVAVCELLVQFNTNVKTEDIFLSDDVRAIIKKLGGNLQCCRPRHFQLARRLGKARRSCIHSHMCASCRSRAVTRVGRGLDGRDVTSLALGPRGDLLHFMHV